jgi:hypothetical protein
MASDEYYEEHDATNNAKRVVLATNIAGEDITNDVLKVEQRFSYGTLTSVSTVAIKAAAGFLHLINIGVPSCPTTIIYDNTLPGGTKIQTLTAGYPVGSHPLDISFSTGLSIDAVVSGGGVIPQILVSYR